MPLIGVWTLKQVMKLLNVSKTHTQSVRSVIEYGGFGGTFDAFQSRCQKSPFDFRAPDGVGTKLMLAINTINTILSVRACMAMCVNDIIAAGAEPANFTGYHGSW